MLFRFNDVSSYKRIIDFKNGTSDRGLYNYSGKLHFYSSATGNTTAIAAGTYVQVVLTRDALKNVVGYLNGIQEFSFADTGDDALIDAANTLRFFKDDGGESSAGAVARIRLYDGALTANEVAALDGTPGGGGGEANLRADYQLQSTYASSVGTPPNLSNITEGGNATNAFATRTVDGTTRTILGFPQGNGVMLSGATGVVSSTSYSIVLLCRLTDISSYRRLIDVTDGTSGDIGFYNYSGNFQHFTGGSGTSTPITENAWVQVVCTRDAAGNVAGYVNGAQQFAFVDTNGSALIDNAVRFFDNQFGGYESAGEIARIRFYDGALTAAEVAALDRLPGATTPSLFINDVTLNEGNGGTTNATFTVSLSPSSQQTITVNYATANGTATAGSDYTAKTGTLTFAPGITTQTVTVAVAGDTALEGNETFTVNLSNAGATPIIDAQGVGTIINDDQLPTLSINNVSIAEGNTGTQIINFLVTLSAASTQTVTVQYATANGTANAGDDFVDKTGTLTFAPGITSKSVAITINGDTTVEPDEDFTINLTAPTNAAIADAQGLGSIINDDGGTLQFSTSVFTVSEAGALATISVTRANGSSGAVSVSYATSNGTASAPGDYTAKTGTLNWADGDTAVKTFTVPVINDGVTEPNETINLTLTNATGGAVLGLPKTAILTILDANPAGLLQFSAPTYSVNESGLAATITVTRTGGSTGAISVTYATSNATGNGSATAGSDYTAKTGTLNWQAGDTTAKTFTVAITQDTVVEGPETLNLALSNPTNGATLDNVKSTAILTIVDDEPLPTITVNNAVVDEGDTGTTPMTFTFTLSGPVTQKVLVDFKTGDTNPISATAGNDYTARRGTRHFSGQYSYANRCRPNQWRYLS